VRIDSLELQMRPRAPHEAADLGVRLCQASAREVYTCYLAVAIPLSLLAMSLFEISPWLPGLALWWAKPWLDRTVLYVLSRAAFGQRTTLRDLWADQRQVWWSQLIITWTWRRLSPWRSFTQAVYQLEGHSFFRLRQRIVQVRRKYGGAAAIMTFAFANAEMFLTIAVATLPLWLIPSADNIDFTTFFSGSGSLELQLIISIAYVIVVLFLEPFYVAAGFGMYLNRRAELEAWDIEQEFRRAFAS
jgi:hypothetical protein